MGRQNIPAEYGPLTYDDGVRFGHACISARENLQRVVDLLLLHNALPEEHGRDTTINKQKQTCNHLAAMNSIVAWERFIRDLCLITARNNHTEDLESRGGLAYLRKKDRTRPGDGLRMLRAASNDTLPDRWRIWKPKLGWGLNLHFPKPVLCGTNSDLEEFTDWWVRMRNGVAHGRLDLNHDWLVLTDADASDGKTLQTGSARAVFVLMLQMIDQSIRVLAETAQLEQPSQFWLPERWMQGHGVDAADRNKHDDRLWGRGRNLGYVDHT